MQDQICHTSNTSEHLLLLLKMPWCWPCSPATCLRPPRSCGAPGSRAAAERPSAGTGRLRGAPPGRPAHTDSRRAPSRRPRAAARTPSSSTRHKPSSSRRRTSFVRPLRAAATSSIGAVVGWRWWGSPRVRTSTCWLRFFLGRAPEILGSESWLVCRPSGCEQLHKNRITRQTTPLHLLCSSP